MGRKKEPPRVPERLMESEKKKIESAAAKCGKIPGEKHDAMFRVVRDGFEWYNDRKLKKMKFNNRNNA